jgi:hypothetical protein
MVGSMTLAIASDNTNILLLHLYRMQQAKEGSREKHARGWLQLMQADVSIGTSDASRLAS